MYPIINRGTWSRVYAYRQHTLDFLRAYQNSPQINILSLGAGFDTMYFWLKSEHPDLSKNLCYIEVDFDQLVKTKTQIIKKQE
jgi:O-methyltransferase involved in polyketide biosynthesis